MKGRIQTAMYDAAALTAANPVLLKGEVVYESDTRKRKLGDGVTAWNDLPYEAAEGGGQQTMTPVVGTNSTADFLGASASLTDVLQKVIAATAIGKIRMVRYGSLQCMVWHLGSTTKVGVLGFMAEDRSLIYGAIEAEEFSAGIFDIPDDEIALVVLTVCKNFPIEAIPADNISTDSFSRFVSDAEKSAWNSKADKSLSNVLLSKSLIANGYYKAADGLMFQWGYTSANSSTPTVYYPTSFYVAPFLVVANIKCPDYSPVKVITVSVTTITSSYVTFLKTYAEKGITDKAISEPIYWLAIGRWK